MVGKTEIFRAFRTAGPLTKAYLGIKFKICPLLQVEPHLPRRGRLVDLGCGKGLFAAILSLGSAERRITGFDLDPKKSGRPRSSKRPTPGPTSIFARPIS